MSQENEQEIENEIEIETEVETEKPTQKLYYDQRSVALRTKQVVYFVQEHDKMTMLELFFKEKEISQSIIVVSSKRKADNIATMLQSHSIKAFAVHGNHRKEQQTQSQDAFNAKTINIIITTDMILSTLELEDVKLVVNYNLPLVPQDYYNRLALMKELGGSVAFISPEDEKALAAIESNMKAEIDEEEMEGFISTSSNQPKNLRRNKNKKPRHRKNKERKVKD